MAAKSPKLSRIDQAAVDGVLMFDPLTRRYEWQKLNGDPAYLMEFEEVGGTQHCIFCGCISFFRTRRCKHAILAEQQLAAQKGENLMGFFNAADYESVEERLIKFHTENPKGRIFTRLLSDPNDITQCVYYAAAYTDKDDLEPKATGHAQEIAGTGTVNKTNWTENCETSAIGRALANMGYATKGKRASREEMEKANRGSQQPQSVGNAARERAGVKQVLTPEQFNELESLLKNMPQATMNSWISKMRKHTGKRLVKELTPDEATELKNAILNAEKNQ